jgi:DNA (cytosine-5)-methyltransferase 1
VSTYPVRRTIEIGSWDIPLARQQEAMGIDWMTLPELSEAIPPRYTEFIGRQLLVSVSNPTEGE